MMEIDEIIDIEELARVTGQDEEQLRKDAKAFAKEFANQHDIDIAETE